MSAERHYFDYAATAPIRPQVAEVFAAETRRAGNPSALHATGQAARRRLEIARAQIAEMMGVSPAEVLFTSGGTESDNQAIKGLWWARNPSAVPARPDIMLPAIEHHAVLESAQWLVSQGANLVWIPVDRFGVVDLDFIEGYLAQSQERCALVSVMMANNEVGTIQPIGAISELTRRYGVPFHTDAVQAVGSIEVAMGEMGADAMSISAHKIGGPVGVGALIVSRSQALIPVLHGGGQERHIRSGTINVAGAIAFARALELAESERSQVNATVRQLRQILIDGISERIPSAIITGHPTDRLPGNVHAIFPGCEGETLQFCLDSAGFDTSTGSACTAGVNRPSHVLIAMGYSPDQARCVQRFTMGRATTRADVDALLEALPKAVDAASLAGMLNQTPRFYT